MLIDGRPLQGASAVRGIGSYARGLLSGFAEVSSPPDVELLLARGMAAPAEAGGRIRVVPRGLRVTHPTLQPVADPFLVAAAVRRIRPDLYHAIEFGQPLIARVPVVVTVHDLVQFVMPDAYPWVRRARILGLRLIRRADMVIAVSAATRRDVLRLAGADPDRVVVVPEGVAATFRPASDAAIAETTGRLGIRRPYLLAVGSFDPRKRIAALCEVVRHVRESRDVGLVIAGDQGTFTGAVHAALEAAGISAHADVVGHVPRTDLVALYSGASCLVFTSAYEGFGLPPLEAMACGAPVAMFDNSSLPEVAGTAAMLIPDGDTGLMADAVSAVLAGPAAVEERRALGLDFAAGFTWKRAAEATLDVYERALQR